MEFPGMGVASTVICFLAATGRAPAGRVTSSAHEGQATPSDRSLALSSHAAVVVVVGPACSTAVPLGEMVRRPSAILGAHGMGSGSTETGYITGRSRDTLRAAFSNLAGNAEDGQGRTGSVSCGPGPGGTTNEAPGWDAKKRCTASPWSFSSPDSASTKQQQQQHGSRWGGGVPVGA